MKIVDLQKVRFALPLMLICALALLSGCSTAEKKKSSLDTNLKKVETDLAQLRQDKIPQTNRLKVVDDFLTYAQSTQGKDVLFDGQCNALVDPAETNFARPGDACGSADEENRFMANACDVKSECDLVGALAAFRRVPISASYMLNIGCAFSEADEAFLKNPEPFKSAIVTTACAKGVGKLPKVLRVPSVGPVAWAIQGTLLAGQAIACKVAYDGFRERIRFYESCMTSTQTACRRKQAGWRNSISNEQVRVSRAKQENKRRLAQCQEKLASFSDESDNPVPEAREEKARIEESLAAADTRIEALEKEKREIENDLSELASIDKPKPIKPKPAPKPKSKTEPRF